ncbi:MAG: CDP-alcohol phosphatidyltransferase family protein [Chloroflexota bacterium]|nr:CDP-alcohol phosphatidyltransferase family protein [Chloroflexota bacterium]
MSSADQQIQEEIREPGFLAQETEDGIDLPVILSFLFDKPNIISLLGLSIGLLSIYFSLVQNFPAAIIALLWAVLIDWFDGLVARRMQGRSESHKLFGGQMDSLVDLVVSATGPAILLLSVGEFSPWFYPGALIIVMAGVLRLAYYGVFGLDENGTHAGLTIDNTPLVVSAVFLLYTLINDNIFSVVLYVAILVMSFLHVAPFRMSKLGGRWYYAVTAYVMIMTAVYAFIIWTQ